MKKDAQNSYLDFVFLFYQKLKERAMTIEEAMDILMSFCPGRFGIPEEDMQKLAKEYLDSYENVCNGVFIDFKRPKKEK